MNVEKLKKLQDTVRIGGKGTARRKKKVVQHHRYSAADDKKIQATLKKAGCNVLPGIDEVNMFKDDGKVLHFATPKQVQLALNSNVVAISGTADDRPLGEMLPRLLQQMGNEQLMAYCKSTGRTASGIRRLEKLPPLKRPKDSKGHGDPCCSAASKKGDIDEDEEEDEIPQLVENFEAVALKGKDRHDDDSNE